MLVIRLQRRGRKGLAMYRIVVQDKRTHPSKEKLIARLGSYNPHTKELSLDKEQAQKFVDNGAQPSDRIISLFEREGLKLPAWVKKSPQKAGTIRNAEKLRKNQPKEEPAEALAKDEEVAEEKPAEETEQEDAAVQALAEEKAPAEEQASVEA